MKITEQIVENFKNLSIVNPQVKLTSGEIRHASEDKECILYWNWEQELKKDVPIYDMNYLLQILKIYEDNNYKNIVVEEMSNELIIKLNDDSMENSYRYGIEEDEINDIFIQVPTKKDFIEKKLRNKIADFDMTKNHINILKKQIEINNSPHVIFKNNEIVITDKSNTSSNKFKMKFDIDCLEESVIPSEKFSFLKENKYKVEIYDNAIVFTNENGSFIYIIVKLDI